MHIGVLAHSKNINIYWLSIKSFNVITKYYNGYTLIEFNSNETLLKYKCYFSRDPLITLSKRKYIFKISSISEADAS